MSNRNALRDLSKRFPTPTELSKTFDDLGEDTDRSVAIVAASIADNVLERLLVRYMKRRNPDLLGVLFGMRGPLSDFHSKILVAEAFGVISPNMAAELNLIRSIRNVFAHATVPVTFQTKEIADAMSNFQMLNVMDEAGAKQSARPHKFDAPRDKRGYLLVVQIICIIVDSDHRERGGDPILSTSEENKTGSTSSAISGSLQRRRVRPSNRPPKAD